MIAYFPEILPDESLYSLVCRYKKYNFPLNHHHVTQQLFGKTHIAVRPDLTVRLKEFSDRTFHILKLDVSDVIYKLTIWPFYFHFLLPNRKGLLLDKLKKVTQKNFLQTSGLLNKYFFGSTLPKYCPVCMADAYKYYGIFYWKKVHQIPSILVCPIHNCFLKTAKVNEKEVTSFYQLVDASQESCDLNDIMVNEDLFLFDLANSMYGLLLEKDKESHLFNKQRLVMLVKMLYPVKKHNENMKLIQDINQFYEIKLLSLFIKDEITRESFFNLNDMRRNFENPLKNLLMIKFLEHQLKCKVDEIDFCVGEGKLTHRILSNANNFDLNESTIEDLKAKKIECRKEWNKILSDNAQLKISYIRKFYKELTKFLLTYDKAWLIKVNKAHHLNYLKIKKANLDSQYIHTDKNYCEEIHKAYETLVKKKYRKIITRTILLRIAQIPRTEALRKLPETNKLIGKLIETKEQKDKRLNRSTF
ncbi:MAG: TniQ family protein [Cyclobacteriaceae bacterium]|nr:TniQ family protein [Cyclobacteriaceae bacterium]